MAEIIPCPASTKTGQSQDESLDKAVSSQVWQKDRAIMWITLCVIYVLVGGKLGNTCVSRLKGNVDDTADNTEKSDCQRHEQN